MKENAGPGWLDTIWTPRFPGQIYQPFTFAQPLPKDGQFKLEGKWTMQAIECGITDTHNTTVLWVPDLRLVAGGDVIYGSCYQMLAYTNTPALRAEWIKAIDKVAALDPVYVVPGHKREGEIDGAWHLENTRKYIEDFGRLFDAGPSSAEEVYQKMMELYPDRFNHSALKRSCEGTFRALKG